MNIAFVTPRFIVGGAETYIIRKSQWLIEHGHNVLVISSGGCFVEMLPKEVKHIALENLSVAPYTLSYNQLKYLLGTLTSILQSEKIDMIEAHNTFPILYVFLSYRGHKIPFVLNVLNELSYDSNWELQKITRILDKLKCYYTLTGKMNDYIEKRCGRSLHPTILPIPLNDPSSKSYVGSNFQNYILTVGRLAPDKMYLKYLIKDFGAFLDENKLYSDKTLVVVGDGPLKNEVEQMAHTINSRCHRKAIVLLGSVVGEELERLYAGCELYVGVGTTLLIAASYAKPSIIGASYTQLQPYAFGFWGTHPEDADVISGSFDIVDRKKSYKNSFQNFYSVSEIQRKQYGYQAYNLFKNNYGLNVIMKKWDAIYYNHTRNVSMSSIKKSAYFLYLFNIMLYPVYFLYKNLRLVYGKIS